VIDDINLPVLLLAAVIAVASPGPATLAIAGTSMSSGRVSGLVLAAGVTTGSLIWSVAGALGLSALMLANGWVLEIIRYFGAGYLLFLAYKAAISALSAKELVTRNIAGASLKRTYAKGVALHLTNPKAVLFYGALYTVGVSVDVALSSLVAVIVTVGLLNSIVFHGYAVLFSSEPIVRGYMRMRCWFEGLFAIAFAIAGLKVLSVRLQ